MTVLMYHYIDRAPAGDTHAGLYVPAEEFRSQLAVLGAMKRRVVVSGEYSEALGAGRATDTVWITFDDGRIDNYETAFPMLAEAGLRATFFAVADWSLKGKAGYVSPAGLKEMADAGMEIGCHTASHPRLARLAPDDLESEIAGAKKRLEDALQVPVTAFCYPYGNWNESVVDAVRTAGFELAVSTIRGNRNAEADRWHLRRAMVQPGRRGARFRYLFSPLYHFVHERKNRRRWKEQVR